MLEFIKKFQGAILGFAAVVAAVVSLVGYIRLDTTDFKMTDLTVVSTSGLLFIEWDLADTPSIPTEIIYYVDGVQFANESYPQGLKDAIGLRTKYISSYIVPPYAQVNPGVHSFKAIAVFNGWRTFFIPETVTFSTSFLTEDFINEESNSSNRSRNGSYTGREWTVKVTH